MDPATNKALHDTSVSLERYMDAKIEALACLMGERIQAMEAKADQRYSMTGIALDRAEREMARRLEGMNELRTQITAERGSYVTREILETKMHSIESRCNTLEKSKANQDGRLWMLGVGITALSGAMTVILNLVFGVWGAK